MKRTGRDWLRRHQRLLAVSVFVLGLFALFELSGARAQVTLAYLQQTIRAHPVSGLAIFMAVFSLGNLIQIPGWIFLAAAVLALGQLWGGVATYIAASVSCVATFFIIRLVGGSALRHLDSPVAGKLLARLDAHPVASIVLLRTLFQTMPALNYTLALSGVRFRHYLLGTLLGLPLPIAIYCIFFDALAKAWAGA